MSLNLDPIAATVNQYMLDTLRFWVVEGRAYDPVSMQYHSAIRVVYEGPGFIGPMGTPGRTTVGMAETPSRMMYEAGVPREVTGIEPESFCTVTASKYNSNMVGMLFRVDGQVESTFHVHRRITLRRDDTRHEDED